MRIASCSVVGEHHRDGLADIADLLHREQRLVQRRALQVDAALPDVVVGDEVDEGGRERRRCLRKVAASAGWSRPGTTKW